jgi:hypothetical protein
MIVYQYIQYLSLILVELIEKFELQGIVKKLDIELKLLKELRANIKQKTEKNKYSDVEKQIKKVKEHNYKWMLGGYNIIQKGMVKIFGQKDFSVYSYKGVPFFNNNQIQFIFNRFWNQNSNKVESLKLKEFTEKIIVFFEIFLHMTVPSGVLEDISKEKVEENESNFDMNDYYVYENKRKDLFKNNLLDEQNIYFFNLLCMVNFVKIICGEVLVIRRKSLLWFKLIAYLIMIKGIWIYDKKYNDLTEELKYIIEETKIVFKNENERKEFRKNIFHFDLPEGIKYEGSLINILIEFYTNLDIEEIEKVVDNAFEIFIKETNIILFGKVKEFIGTNVK